MKKNLLKLMTGSLVIICSVSIAQPTLTATGVNPVIGENYTLNGSAYVSPGSAGASQTWNLSSMSGASAGITNVVAPSSTTYGSSFTTSTVAAENSTAGTVNYLKTSSTAMQNSGIVSGTTVITYSNFEDYLHFPTNFSNTFTDSWAASFVSSGYTFYRTGTTTVTADSYGTLITPNGTYTNVTRIHFVQDYQDSAFIGTPYVITYDNDQYMWYKDGIHVQIASVYTLTTSAGGPYTGGSYVLGSLGIDDASFISASNVFPNPAVDQITVDFTLTENKSVTVQVFNALGQKMDLNQSAEGFTGANTIQLDVATLPEGIYFAQILLEGNIAATKRFVVAK